MAKKLDNEKIRETIRQNLTQLRTKKGLTQGDVAAAVDKSASGVASWEQGLSLPDPAVLYKLSKLYNVDMNYFYEDHQLKFDLMTDKEKIDIAQPKDKYELVSETATLRAMIRTIIREEMARKTSETDQHISIPVEEIKFESGGKLPNLKHKTVKINAAKGEPLKFRRGEDGKYRIVRESKHTGTSE